MIKRLFASLAILCASAGAQISVAPIVQPHATFVNSAGSACYACSLYSYAAGTTTPLATYVDATGTSQNANPIILDASGGANIWLGSSAYKFVLIDSTGATIWSVDQVTAPGVIPSPTASGTYYYTWQPNGTAISPTAASASSLGLPTLTSGTSKFPNPIFAPLISSVSGVSGTPVANSSSPFFVNSYDINTSVSTPTVCNGRSPAGLGSVDPAASICLLEYGTNSSTSTPTALYSSGEYAAGSNTYAIGWDLNTIADAGSLPTQVSGVFLTTDNSGWTINSCTLTSGTSACSISGATLSSYLQTALVNTGLYISGNSANDTGQGICVITAATSTSITCTNTNHPSGSASPVSGGLMAPNHLAWAHETNVFNNNHDPGNTTPVSGEVVAPFHGITLSSTGNFPVSESFYTEGNAYAGFRCDDAISSCFVAGTPTPGNPEIVSIGYEARPRQVASSGNNYPSLSMQFDMSVYNGSSYTESANIIVRQPVSATATGSSGELAFITPGATDYILDNGQHLSVQGAASTPTYAFVGAQTSGYGYDTGSGNPAVYTNGADVMDFNGTGPSTTLPINAATFSGTGVATFATGAAGGTGMTTPTCLSGYRCDSVSGSFSFTTGTSPLANGVVLTVTLGGVVRPFAASCNGFVTLQSTGALTTINGAYGTTTGLPFNATGAALAASTAYSGHYDCH